MRIFSEGKGSVAVCSEKLMITAMCAGRVRFVARNYMPQGAKGELDLVGYDGETIAFVEIRTRTVLEDISGPALSVSYVKQLVRGRTAQRFLANRHQHDCPTRLDVLAIDNTYQTSIADQPAQRRLQPATPRSQ
jgi:Holliday junction resolvase-like predicted endonuclease